MQVETIPPFAGTEAEIDYVYLLMNVGNMLSAGEPALLLAGGAYWKIPVWCAYPEFKRREHLGDLIMDTDSGEIDLGRSSFTSAAAIEARADAIYHSLLVSGPLEVSGEDFSAAWMLADQLIAHIEPRA